MTYREGFDTLGNRIEQAQDSYIYELIDALLSAILIAMPFAIYFFGMTK